MINIRKLETELWESADLLRAGSKLTSNQYCMPVLGLIFLRYAYSRFKLVEAEILKDRPVRGGRVLPVEASDFVSRSALFLPREAQYAYLVNLPENIAAAGLTNWRGEFMGSLGEAVNNAMELVEQQSEQLSGVLPKTYTMFSDELLAELLRIFNNSALDDVGGDIIGRIYEYFLNKFAKNIAQDDGVFFTPKSLVKMIVNVLEPEQGVLLEKTLSTLIQRPVSFESGLNWFQPNKAFESGFTFPSKSILSRILPQDAIFVPVCSYESNSASDKSAGVIVYSVEHAWEKGLEVINIV